MLCKSPTKMNSVFVFFFLDGSAVDPECGLADNAHVYCGNALERQNVKYSAVLGLVDIENNKNSYYRIQLLESDEIKL